MSEHELNQYLDWQDKCYEEDTCPPPHLQTADKIFNRMIALDRNPNSAYLEIEPAQIRIILNSLVSKDETDEQIAKRKIFDYISENVTDYKTHPVILSDVIDWLGREE